MGEEKIPNPEDLEEVYPLFVGALTAEETEIDRLMSTSPSLTILERTVASLDDDTLPISADRLRLAMEKCARRV